MSEHGFNIIVLVWIGIALVIFPVMFFVKAPYGRHASSKWGVLINSRLAWFFMEMPVLLVFLFFLLSGDSKGTMTYIIGGLFLIHYINRVFIYPFRIKSQGKKMPLAVLSMAVVFNTMNGFINGYYLGNLANYNSGWQYSFWFILGLSLFIAGMVINWHSDNVLINLRKAGRASNNEKPTYYIPYGGLFKYISCPNFFGEIVEWIGFAILCGSLPALAFAIWTIINLLPRAIDHHKWYRKTFEEYPVKRKAIFPFIL